MKVWATGVTVDNEIFFIVDNGNILGIQDCAEALEPFWRRIEFWQALHNNGRAAINFYIQDGVVVRHSNYYINNQEVIERIRADNIGNTGCIGINDSEDIVVNLAVSCKIEDALLSYATRLTGGCRYDEDFGKHLKLGPRINSIDKWTFRGSKIYDIEFNNQLIIIEERAFAKCRNLEEVSTPDSLRAIGAGAFDSCYKLEKLKLNEGLKVIEARAFKNCIGLLDVTLPRTITRYSHNIFEGCYSLKTIYMPVEVPILPDFRQLADECGAEIVVY